MASEKLFRDKIVVVTGSSAGIGRAIAYAFASEGAHLGLISRNEQRLLSLQQELATYGARSLVLPFDWVKSRLPNRAEPVPPIYQPEVAAQAVLWAARHYRREYVVGFPAWKGVFGNMLLPGFEDRYLAKTGYSNQQTAEKKPAHQPDNLFRSVDGNFGAHGRFDEKAIKKDWFFELTKYARFNTLLLVLLIIIVIVFLLV